MQMMREFRMWVEEYKVLNANLLSDLRSEQQLSLLASNNVLAAQLSTKNSRHAPILSGAIEAAALAPHRLSVHA
jgi:hypothetical protein